MPSADKIEKYRRLLVNFFPMGRLWDFKNQPKLNALVATLAIEFARVDDRVATLLGVEVDPRKATELLEDWERAVGLPDECTPIVATEEQRRQQVVQKLTSVGGISAAYYEFLIEQLGFDAVVTNPLPFRVGGVSPDNNRGSKVGDALTNDFEDPFTVGMTVGNTLNTVGWRFYFDVELAGPGPNELVECTIKKLKPAETGVTFTYV